MIVVPTMISRLSGNENVEPILMASADVAIPATSAEAPTRAGLGRPTHQAAAKGTEMIVTRPRISNSGGQGTLECGLTAKHKCEAEEYRSGNLCPADHKQCDGKT